MKFEMYYLLKEESEMEDIQTKFGSIESYEKGTIEILQGTAKDYAFSNLFEVADNAKPFERIAIAKNFEYVVEVLRIEGSSSWYICKHDEFSLVMSGEVEVSFIEPEISNIPQSQGAVLLDDKPKGQFMGKIIAHQGHMVLLPQERAYRLSSRRNSVVIIQTLLGNQTIEKWKDICHSEGEMKC